MMKQQTLVAFWGKKPDALCDFLYQIQDKLQQSLTSKHFIPRDSYQMHGTLIGLESVLSGGCLYNRNIWQAEGVKLEMDLKNLPALLNKYFPMEIRFGGFRPAFNDFTSGGDIPWHRSFGFHRDTQRGAVLGWPHDENDFSGMRLVNFRNEMRQQCQALHKYLNDNDFYIVVGDFKGHTRDHTGAVGQAEDEIREFLEGNPFHITITLEDISLMSYSDPALPQDSTEIVMIR